MLAYNTRILIFLIGCVGFRLMITFIAKNIDINYLPYMGYLALLPAIGFAYIFISGSRKIGFEAGGKIWWNNLRPIHSLLYFLFAYNAILKRKNTSWKFLALDIIIGLLAFLNHHFIK